MCAMVTTGNVKYSTSDDSKKLPAFDKPPLFDDLLINPYTIQEEFIKTIVREELKKAIQSNESNKTGSSPVTTKYDSEIYRITERLRDAEKQLSDFSKSLNNIPKESHARKTITTAIISEYLYGIVGLTTSVIAMLGGSFLCLNGVIGNASWTAKILGASSTINDAAPGVILFSVGVFLALGR